MEKENRRQLFHLFLGLLLVVLIYYDYVTAVMLGVVLLIGLVLSFAAKSWEIPVVSWFLRTFERERDMRYLPGKGIIFMFAGAFAVVFLFPKDVALASMIILALGDSVSALLGQLGKIRHPFNRRKFTEGMLTGFIAAFLGALLFVNTYEALIAAAAAMIVEGIDYGLEFNPIDDNLTMPVAAGIVIILLRMIV